MRARVYECVAIIIKGEVMNLRGSGWTEESLE